ncbi:hypothetical protein B0O99DRAFT_592243 [Bisporella sp. PMI_857]|nr:hypothetical protein B0O99DRAFT_592243 [Bisporella sp. PMI_857]
MVILRRNASILMLNVFQSRELGFPEFMFSVSWFIVAYANSASVTTVAKKMFSVLGSKRSVDRNPLSPISKCVPPLSKIVESEDEYKSLRDGSYPEVIGITQNEKRPSHYDVPAVSELPNTAICEMEGVFVSEMDGNWDYSQELPDSEACRYSDIQRCSILEPTQQSNLPWTFRGSSEGESPRASLTDLPRLNTGTALELPRAGIKSTSTPDWLENPMSATIVSPMSPNGGFEYGTFSSIDISPTDSQASGKTLFTDSGYSSATMESSWNGSETNFDFIPSRQNSKGKEKEMFPSNMNSLSNGDPAFMNSMNFSQMYTNNDTVVFTGMTTQSENRYTSSESPQLSSPHWTDSKSLVKSFSKVLGAHLQHSRKSLEEMAPNSTTKELLSLSSSSIVSIGFQVLEGILQDRYPAAVMPLFAFTHVAYALAIAVDHDQSKVQTPEWFQDLLSMVDNISSDRQRQTYTQIVRVIWQPRVAVSTEAQNWVEALRLNDNKLVKACKHFLDIQESFAYRHKMAAIQASIPQFTFPQQSFMSTSRTRIIEELFKNNSTVAFIEDVAMVNKRLDQGLIIELRQLELELICAGKLASRSDTLYDQFLSHVTSQCDALYSNSHIKSRATHHLETISETLKLLPVEDDIDEHPQDEVQQRAQDQGSEDQVKEPTFDFQFPIPDSGYSTLDSDNAEALQAIVSNIWQDAHETMQQTHFEDFNGLSESYIMNSAPVFQQIEQHNYLSMITQPTPSFQPTPHQFDNSSFQSIPQAQIPDRISHPNNPSSSTPAPPSTTLRCPCGYIPTGEEKWKASNLARHKRIQHATQKYRCGFRGCKSEFTRSDNLKSHQRDKGHLLIGMGMSRENSRNSEGDGEDKDGRRKDGGKEDDAVGRRPSKKRRVEKETGRSR